MFPKRRTSWPPPNGIRSDNRLENLELWTTAHPKGQRIEEKVEFALEMLRRYKPELLA